MTLTLRTASFCLFLLAPWAPAQTLTEPPPAQTGPADQAPATPVTDGERGAVTIVRDDLTLHLVPAEARAEGLAMLTLRNDGAVPLTRIPLQLTGSLRWLTISAAGKKVVFTQSAVPTDADHLGFVQEAVLAEPLAAGATVQLTAFYAGVIRQSSERLTSLGTAPDRAAETDWDAIVPTTDEGATSLRGFGQVLWYPCAAPTAALGDGNRLFELAARQRRLNAAATMALHLTVEYAGDPPDSVLFNGRPQPLTKQADSDNTLIDDTHGVATASFAEAPIGAMVPSLFLTAQHATATEGQLLSVITAVPEVIPPYAAAATSVAGVIAPWLGATPTTPLTVLDHAGAPYLAGTLLVAHLSAAAASEAIAPELVRPMTHAWLPVAGATNVWLEQGLAEFMALLWTEKTDGRDAALATLRHDALLIALAEPDLSADPQAVGQPLTQATSDVYLHQKSAAVLWQLRGLLGDEKLRAGLIAYRKNLAGSGDPELFEHTLERTSGQDLGWFFKDWVTRDRGLPDLSILHVNARPELTGKSAISGYLVSVEVRNDGDATADVSVVVRSESASIADHVRVGPHANGSVRIFFQGGPPDRVAVNDGSVPELRTTAHTAEIVP